MAADCAITPVTSREDLQAFAQLPTRLHPRDLAVPLLDSVLTQWYRGKGPQAGHGPLELVVARDSEGRVVGRTTLHSDDRMDARLGEMTLLLGATDFDRAQTLSGLVDYAQERAAQQSRTALLGPVTLLPNQQGGVVTAGFDERGFIDSPWNPAHYPTAWADAGFEELWPGATWICEGLGSRDATADFGPERPLPPGVAMHVGSRRDLAGALPLLRRMLNASFAELPYFTPISPAELRAATDGLAWLLDESLLLYLTEGDVPVAFALAVPDITPFLQSTHGALGWWQQARLVLTRRRYHREAILLIKGTVPGARGRGLMSILSRQLLVNLQAGGYHTLRVTQIGQDNAGSAAQFSAMGGRPLHQVTFYRKSLV